ncbi:hypothetical protein B0H19DRAFT_431841 [Mycena capillaripes]|nr:hypothetical protein B0H19DRAFT_431841 [Mycena capillaripes]
MVVVTDQEGRHRSRHLLSRNITIKTRARFKLITPLDPAAKRPRNTDIFFPPSFLRIALLKDRSITECIADRRPRADLNPFLYANCIALGSLILLVGHALLHRRSQLHRDVDRAMFGAARFASCLVLTGITAGQRRFEHTELQQCTSLT